jgi:hypothetical protein
VTVTVASHAQPAGGSEAVLINGTAASPTSSTGQPSDVSVFKYPAHGMGIQWAPEPRDPRAYVEVGIDGPCSDE